MSRRRGGGIALISAVIMMGLLMMLLGAFMQVNRSHLWLLNASEARQTAHSACQAGYEYVLFRLEHDRMWATTDFTGSKDGVGTDLEVEELDGSRTVRGTLASAGAWFEVTIFNNLNSPEASGDLPKESALLEITGGTAGGTTKEARSLLHVAPLFDSSALTRGRVEMLVSRFNLRSKDAWRNQLRAEKGINVPEVLTDSLTRFLLPDSSQPDSRGRLWSRANIESAGEIIADDQIPTANANSGGVFVPRSQRFEIFDLSADSVKLPGSVSNVDAGQYRFTKVTAEFTVNATYVENLGATGDGLGVVRTTTITQSRAIDVLEHWPPGATEPDVVYRANSRIDDLGLETTMRAEGGDGDGDDDDRGDGDRGDGKGDHDDGVTLSLAGGDITSLRLPYNCRIEDKGDVVALDDQNKVLANLLEQKVDVESGTTVNVDGPLGIVSSDPVKLPRLNLGTAGERAAIVTRGNLDLLNANTDGVGTLISKEESVNVQPLGSNFAVDATATNGLVLYAKKDIKLQNPDANGAWDFKGLAYAGDNFVFDGQGAKTTLEGTVVARNGNIRFEGGGETDFVYNPEYLKVNIGDLPLRRVPLERLWWRE